MTPRLVVAWVALIVFGPGPASASEPDAPISYRREVSAVLSRGGCNAGACHGNLSGKGGFRLSLRGEDPDFDYEMITRDHLGRRIDRFDPSSSLLLAKPTGAAPHEGGQRFAADSPEAAILAGWISAGARDDREESAALVGLGVDPSDDRVEYPELSRPIRVTARFADGSSRDVTHLAAFEIDDPSRSRVEPGGVLVRSTPGETVVSIRYLTGWAVARVAFLPESTGEAWAGPEPATKLDATVLAKLEALRITPSPPIGDAAFVRRLTLDLIGVLPTPEEIRAFEADGSPDRKARLVRTLLDRPEYADFWALKWADLLRNEEKAMGPKGVWALQRWLRDQVAADRPLSEFAAEIVTGEGSTWDNPPASFYRTNRSPEAAAESFAQVFLGVRLQCAKCHNHPFDAWKQDDYYGLAAAFANLGRKSVNNRPRDGFDKHEITGDELIFVKREPARIVQPRSKERLAAAPPGADPLELGPGFDARDELARWLTTDNRQFARNLANRVWFHLVGRGVVEPVDDFRATNPPSNPALLEALTDSLIRSGMRVKPLIEEIATSEVYAFSAEPNESNREDEANFARATVKLLPAEVLLDVVGQAAGGASRFDEGREAARAVELAGVRMGSDFLRVFGKPERLLTCECERSESTSLAQAFQLLNGDVVRSAVERPDNRIGRALEDGVEPDALLEELFRSSLGRSATDPERAGALEHVDRAADARTAWEDVLWAVLNSKEFLLRH